MLILVGQAEEWRYDDENIRNRSFILKEIDESYAETVLQYYDRNREFLKAWEEYRPDDFLR